MARLTKTETHFPGVLKYTDTGRQCDSAKASKPLKNKMFKQENMRVSCVRPPHSYDNSKLVQRVYDALLLTEA